MWGNQGHRGAAWRGRSRQPHSGRRRQAIAHNDRCGSTTRRTPASVPSVSANKRQNQQGRHPTEVAGPSRRAITRPRAGKKKCTLCVAHLSSGTVDVAWRSGLSVWFRRVGCPVSTGVRHLGKEQSESHAQELTMEEICT